MAAVTIVWFRHDLRLDDNPAFLEATRRGSVLPVFIWAPEEEAPWEPGAASRWWLHQSLESLSEKLQKVGCPLVIRRGPTLKSLQQVAREVHATDVVWNRRYEPAVVKRDTVIKKTLSQDGLHPESFGGSLLYEPSHIATKQGNPYQVFTPFWRALLARDEPAEPTAAPRKVKPVSTTVKSLSLKSLKLLPQPDWSGVMTKTWNPGEPGAKKLLKSFLSQGLDSYDDGRNRPDQQGTSSLSPHLHFGEISPRRVWHAVREAVGGKPAKNIVGSPEVYLRELGWREFANHLLFHFPHTPDEPLRKDYKRFPWVDDPVGLRAWQKGHTGFPIVDAGMQQLWATGWMHNRVRMIVASFLVKDLRISWLEGARWFWDTLVDADLAANTLGWQWAAGCGADAAPYFRIFNPTSQQQKFDPEEKYIDRWVVRDDMYPEPIVDHAEARKQALSALKQVTGK